MLSVFLSYVGFFFRLFFDVAACWCDALFFAGLLVFGLCM